MRLDLAPLNRGSHVDLFLLTPDDVSEQYVSWLNDHEVNQFLESRFQSHTLASTRAFVAEALASRDNLFLGIRTRPAVDSPSGRHVGNIKLGPINEHHRTSEVGILIGDRAAWGRGVATAAIATLCDISRIQLSLRKVTAGCYAANVGSQRAFEKAGFAVEAVRKQQVLLNGVPEDVVLMGRCLG
jgi:ribosomal-protein-alanine N-acetyltransferase